MSITVSKPTVKSGKTRQVDADLLERLVVSEAERAQAARARAALIGWIMRVRGEIGYMLNRLNESDLEAALSEDEKGIISTMLHRCDHEFGQAERLAAPVEFTTTNHTPV